MWYPLAQSHTGWACRGNASGSSIPAVTKRPISMHGSAIRHHFLPYAALDNPHTQSQQQGTLQGQFMSLHTCSSLASFHSSISSTVTMLQGIVVGARMPPKLVLRHMTEQLLCTPRCGWSVAPAGGPVWLAPPSG